MICEEEDKREKRGEGNTEADKKRTEERQTQKREKVIKAEMKGNEIATRSGPTPGITGPRM